MTAALKIVFFIGDLLLLNVSILLSFYLVSGENTMDVSGKDIYLLVLSNLSWLFLTMVSTPYNVTRGMTLSRIVKSQAAFLFIHLLVVACLILLFKLRYNYIQIAAMYVTFVAGLVTLRVIVLYLRKIIVKDDYKRNYILLGKNSLSYELRRFFLMNPEERYNFRGYFDIDPGNFRIDEIQEFCQREAINEIFCCIPNVTDKDMKALMDFGLDSLIKVKFVTKQTESAGGSIQLSRFDQLPGEVVSHPMDLQVNQFFKRVFDLVFAGLVVILVMSWLIPIIGLLIKLDSKGPIFFAQLRSGKFNKPFLCLKFRTMKVNSESETKQASRNDSRITPLGQFLRKTSIDELPQFINVLIGTMSVVGPRPHMLRHTDDYSKLIETFMARHYVKPGITGLAQCLGYRGETKDLIDMENRVRMDRYYIENWSFWLDIKIIFLTVVSLLRGSEKAF